MYHVLRGLMSYEILARGRPWGEAIRERRGFGRPLAHLQKSEPIGKVEDSWIKSLDRPSRSWDFTKVEPTNTK